MYFDPPPPTTHFRLIALFAASAAAAVVAGCATARLASGWVRSAVAANGIADDWADVPPDGAQGPAAGFSKENGMCVYEFSIPLQDSAFGHYSLGAGAGTGPNLTVTAGLSAEMRRAMQEQMRPQSPPEENGSDFGGGRPRGRGGSGGGAGPGGPRCGPPGGQAVVNPCLSVAVRLADGP